MTGRGNPAEEQRQRVPELRRKAGQVPGQPGPPAELAEAWHQALEAAGTLYRATAAFHNRTDQAFALLSAGLRDLSQRRRTLLLMSYLDPGYALALADDLVDLAHSHRDALLVRQIFGRLRRDQAKAVVVPAVRRSLETGTDDEAFRRMAELLYHLGLTDDLRQLTQRALASEDPGIREVGSDFSPDEDDAQAG